MRPEVAADPPQLAHPAVWDAPGSRGRATVELAVLDAPGSRGQATVELALVLPLLLLAALALVQVGVVVRDQLAVVHAAREAARVAAVDPDPSGAEEAARRVLSRARVEVGPRPAVGEQLQVEVRYRARTTLPLVGPLFPDPLLTAEAVMRVER